MPSYLNKVKNQETMAAIDLGSNALRAVIARKSGETVEIIKSFREPLRLGEDVFRNGMISQQKMIQTEEAFIKLFHIFTEYNVTDLKAFATSAMRDSKNGAKLIRQIAHSTGIELKTIKGNEEAEVIFTAVKSQLNLKKKTSLLMDIGGGSTELILVKDEKIIAVESFNIGTVRLLSLGPDFLKSEVDKSIEKMVLFIKGHIRLKDLDIIIGTGGNLKRIGKIRKKVFGKGTSDIAQFDEIHHMQESIISMSYVDRIRRLELDQNRADVILPAIVITNNLMKRLKLSKIYLPKVGLKEGIILSMLRNTPETFIIRD